MQLFVRREKAKKSRLLTGEQLRRQLVGVSGPGGASSQNERDWLLIRRTAIVTVVILAFGAFFAFATTKMFEYYDLPLCDELPEWNDRAPCR